MRAWLSFCFLLCLGCGREAQLAGDLELWQTVTLTFPGPQASETGDPNPFTAYAVEIEFTSPSAMRVTVPGFFAADGDAAETGADSGDRWRARFTPDEEGEWSYEARLDGRTLAAGGFRVGPSTKTPPDFRARGMLRYAGERYPVFAGDGERFLKGGANSPENLLAYADFDATASRGGAHPDFLHRYEPHIADWREGDPSWRGGRGKGFVGALNYLASQGVNSVYFLTQNVGGDGDDVWPWVSPEDFARFDVSKLEQWEIVFEHAGRLGIQLHVVLAERENDRLLDGGDLGPNRRLYYRELVARFAHHRALVWNLGEETTLSPAQLKADAEYIRQVDIYRHPIVVHTLATPDKHEETYAPLLGYEHFEGASMQIREDPIVHSTLVSWIRRSADARRPWIVTFDEQRRGNNGVAPDDMDDSRHDERRDHLWAALMAGAAGIEWYFGYDYPHDDVTLEDFRTRAEIWRLTRLAREFFEQHVPFWEMVPADELSPDQGAFVLAKAGAVYAVYAPQGGTARLDLAEGSYTVRWFDPDEGGALQAGSLETVEGPGVRSLGQAPSKPSLDWVALVERAGQ